MADNLALPTPSSIVGMSDFDTIITDISANDYTQQDTFVFNRKTVMTFFDTSVYKENQEIAFITIKFPLYTQAETLSGLLGISIPLTPKNLFTLNLKERSPLENIISTLCRASKEKYSNELLSNREKECVLLLVKGLSMREIAEKLGLSKRTIEDYIERSKNKIGCIKKRELVQYAIERYFIPIT